MKDGRREVAANGSTHAFSTLLKAINTLERGNGVMFPLEPCMQLQSKTVAEPADPVNSSIPCLSASMERLSASGVPTSWALNGSLRRLDDLLPRQQTNVLCDPGMIIKPPLCTKLSAS